MPHTTPSSSPLHMTWPVVRPTRVTLPLMPHPTDGRLVAPGDRVTTGERVHRDAGASCVVSVNGAVRDDAPASYLSIDVDPDAPLPPEPPHHDHHDRDAVQAKVEAVRHTDRGSWFERLRATGVIVDRHGCPDLLEQLRQSLTRPVDAVVCCALDPESSLPHASVLANRFATELMAGVSTIGRLVGAPTVTTTVDATIPTRTLVPLRHWGKRLGVTVARMANPYPQTDPTLLLYTLLNRRLRPGRLPTDVGVILLDAAAAVAIGSVVITGRAMTGAFVAARDVATRQVRRALVPVGTDLATVLRSMNFAATGVTLRAGELLRDGRVGPDTAVGFGELTFHVAPTEPVLHPDPCVRSGWCVEICPTRIQPAGLLDAAQRHDADMADHHGLHACIECGLCTYVCPSKLPLLQTIRGMKSGVLLREPTTAEGA